MSTTKRQLLRIESNFAACEGTYWISFCAVSGFIAVYLTHKGLSNTQIGLTTSIGSALSILLQLVMSGVMDKHPRLPIKGLISVLGLLGIVAAACLNWLSLPVAMMIAAFAACYGFGLCNNGYLNAQLVQFNNVGIPARYGWPRGVGSFCYAVAAYVYGKLVAAYNPDILMPCFLVGMTVCIVCVMLMPNPQKLSGRTVQRAARQTTSYKEMLAGNPTLVVLLVCLLLNGIGNMAGYTFVLRAVERVGGSTVEYGISEFVRAIAEVPTLFASGWLVKHFKTKSMLSISFLCYGIKQLLVAFAPSIGFIYAASAFNMFCVGFSTFSSVMLVNAIVREDETVRGQSLAVLFGSLGSIIGSAYAGAMIDRVGLTAMLVSSFFFCFLAFLGMVFLCKPEKMKQRG